MRRNVGAGSARCVGCSEALDGKSESVAVESLVGLADDSCTHTRIREHQPLARVREASTRVILLNAILDQTSNGIIEGEIDCKRPVLGHASEGGCLEDLDQSTNWRDRKGRRVVSSSVELRRFDS